MAEEKIKVSPNICAYVDGEHTKLTLEIAIPGAPIDNIDLKMHDDSFWTDSTIRSILVNPIYAGDMVWNRRTDARFHRISKGQAVDRESVHGARLVPNQKEDWIVVRDAHSPLISRRLFEQAKQRLESYPKAIEQRQRISKLNAHGKTWNGQRSRFILSGLMKCSLCGCRYQGVTRVKGKKQLDGKRVRTYYFNLLDYRLWFLAQNSPFSGIVSSGILSISISFGTTNKPRQQFTKSVTSLVP